MEDYISWWNSCRPEGHQDCGGLNGIRSVVLEARKTHIYNFLVSLEHENQFYRFFFSVDNVSNENCRLLDYCDILWKDTLLLIFLFFFLFTTKIQTNRMYLCGSVAQELSEKTWVILFFCEAL